MQKFYNWNPLYWNLALHHAIAAEFARNISDRVKFAGVTYNIPVCVLLQEGHPEVPPLVYVRPTSTMAIMESQYVDKNGRVYHPYLHEWNYVWQIID